MSRKPTKGYYVKGQFIAEGSELDLELKRQLKGDVDVSKSDLKRESEELQKLGEALLTVSDERLDKLDLPEKLREALDDMKRLRDFEARRRQMQFIGKLMRKLDDNELAAARAMVEEQHLPSAEATMRLHEAEQWRERLIANDEAVAQWMSAYPGTDSQQLRALVRQARKDAPPDDKTAAHNKAQGTAPRRSRSYRELFQLVQEQLEKNNE